MPTTTPKKAAPAKATAPKAAAPEPKVEEAKQTPDQLKSALYSQAQRTLRERHTDEFEGILAALYSENGLERVRRLTPAERAERDAAAAEAKAEKALADLLAKNPTLAAKVKIEADSAETPEEDDESEVV
jgi:hypothetical protein